jgi:hypothetical protein
VGHVADPDLVEPGALSLDDLRNDPLEIVVFGARADEMACVEDDSKLDGARHQRLAFFGAVGNSMWLKDRERIRNPHA